MKKINFSFFFQHIRSIVSILVFLFSIGIQTSAQTPGYLGKRFLFGVEAPMIVSYNLQRNSFDYIIERTDGYYDFKESDSSPFFFKIKPTAFIEFVLNRKNSIKLYGRLFSSKIDVTSFTDTTNNRYSENYRTFYPTGRAKAKTVSFGFKYRIFTGDGISPVGKYLSFGAEYASNKFNFEDVKFLTYNNRNEPIYKTPVDSVSSTVILLFGFGSQFPLGKSLMLNFGWEAGLPFSLFWGESLLDDGGYPNPPTEDWVKTNTKNHFFRSYVFNLTIGIALIP